jgi:hypothetical protein
VSANHEANKIAFGESGAVRELVQVLYAHERCPPVIEVALGAIRNLVTVRQNRVKLKELEGGRLVGEGGAGVRGGGWGILSCMRALRKYGGVQEQGLALIRTLSSSDLLRGELRSVSLL